MSQLAIETFIKTPDEIIKLNKWIFENIQPYIKERILELGSGSGIFSSLLIEQGISLHLSAETKVAREKLYEKLNGSTLIKAVHNIDLLHSEFKNRYSNELEVFSTLIAVNITENNFLRQIELENAKHLLRKGGNIIIVLPSSIEFYPGLDYDLEELKRHNRKYLKLQLSGFQIMKARYFNLSAVENTSVFALPKLAVIAVARKN